MKGHNEAVTVADFFGRRSILASLQALAFRVSEVRD